MAPPPNGQLWSLVHRKYGPLSTFAKFEDAQQTMADVIRDEPGWANELCVEPVQLRVAERYLPLDQCDSCGDEKAEVLRRLAALDCHDCRAQAMGAGHNGSDWVPEKDM